MAGHRPLTFDQLRNQYPSLNDVPMAVLIPAIEKILRDMDTKVDQVMQTHAALFEEKVQGLKDEVTRQINWLC